MPTTRTRCRACKSYFQSERSRLRWCPFCSATITRETDRLTTLLESVQDSPPEMQKEAISEMWDALTCKDLIRRGKECGWRGNGQRYIPKDALRMKTCIEGWVITAHCHFMRHIFWNRFLPSYRFWPRPETEREVSLTQWEAEQPDWKEVAFVRKLKGGEKVIRASSGTIKDYSQRLPEGNLKRGFRRLYRSRSQSSRRRPFGVIR